MQNKPNFQNAQMNVSQVSTKDYAKKDTWWSGKNKPNSNPIQTQSNPIKANKMPKQTQYKPNQTQSEILNQKSQIHSHPAGNKLRTPRRQSWGCFDLTGWATPKNAGLGLSLVTLRYYSRTTDKI